MAPRGMVTAVRRHTLLIGYASVLILLTLKIVSDKSDTHRSLLLNGGLSPWKRHITALAAANQISKTRVVHSSNPNVISGTIELIRFQQTQQRQPLMVLLVNSLGRSGSTFTGEIISTFSKNTFYVFEPLKILQDLGKPFSKSYTASIVKRTFDCDIQGLKYLYGMFSDMTMRYMDQSCRRSVDCIRKRCLYADLRLIKVIRLPLAHMEAILADERFKHVKIIYMTRDPRPQIASRTLYMEKGNPWTGRECPRYADDVLAYHVLSSIHPTSIHLIRYEDLCRNLYVKTAEMETFVNHQQGDNHEHETQITDVNHPLSLPERTAEYLNYHTDHLGSLNTLNTYRNTHVEWNHWRSDQNLPSLVNLEHIEYMCSEPMEKLGYVKLSNWVNVRNPDIEAIRDYDCSYFNNC